VALIGLQMNMVSQRAYAIVILMTAITTILPPPFLRILFRDEMLDADDAEGEAVVPADV